jgi:hypothetical protein
MAADGPSCVVLYPRRYTCAQASSRLFPRVEPRWRLMQAWAARGTCIAAIIAIYQFMKFNA